MTKKTEVQTSFEDHPDAGSMMKAALAVTTILSTRVHIEHIYTEQREAVATARANGVSWQKIGDALGVTRSAAQKYYGG